MFTRLLCQFVLILCIALVSSILRDDCASYGFNVAVLSCETCEHINKILDHSGTYDNCKTCCIEKIEEIYEVAILDVDKRYLSFMKEISLVVEKKKELNLKVRYRSGNPTLYMYKTKNDNEPTETITVSTWDKSTFEEYLLTHLKSNKKNENKKNTKQKQAL